MLQMSAFLPWPVCRVTSGAMKCGVPAKKVDIRLPGKWKSNSYGARPVHQNHLDDQVKSDQ